MNGFDDEDTVEEPLFNLVYCSSASAEPQSIDIDELVTIARRNNARRKITGWLVYSSGIFFQWLEGHRDDVKGLMTKIASDPRHHNIVVLSETEEVRERLFADWGMELVSPEDIRAVLFDALTASNDPKNRAALRRLVQELDSRGTAAH